MPQFVNMATTVEIQQALRYLSSVCDNARALDGQGFSAADTTVGKFLAGTPSELWSKQETFTAEVLCHRYRGQLNGFGIEWEAPTRAWAHPTELWAVVDHDPGQGVFVFRSGYHHLLVRRFRAMPGRRWVPDTKVNTIPDNNPEVVRRFVEWGERELAEVTLTKRAEQTLRDRSSKPEREKQKSRVSYDTVVCKWVVEFPYSPEVVERLKEVFGKDARWDGKRKRWHVHASVNLVYLEQFARKAGMAFVMPDRIIRRWDITPDDTTRVYVARFEYDREWVKAIKTLPAASWNKEHKTWGVPYSVAGELLELLNTLGVDIDDKAHSHLERTAQELEAVGNLSNVTSDEDADLRIGAIQLRKYQEAAVVYATKRRRCIIADEPGLGKTFEALGAVHHTGEWPVVVVCPATVKINWERETLKMFPTKKVHVVWGLPKSDKDRLPTADVTIINYDILSQWVGKLSNYASVIVDEAHLVKNEKAQRSAAVAELLAGAPDGLLMLLTGTPVPSRPRELENLLNAIGRMDDLGGTTSFLFRYCGAKMNKKGYWTFDGASNIAELSERLRKICWVRRKKKDVLKDLPDKSVDQLIVNLEGEQLEAYREAEQIVYQTLRAALADPTRNPFTRLHGKKDRVEDNEGATVADWLMKVKTAKIPLAEMTALRGLAATLKIGTAVTQATDFLEQTDRKLLIFAHHRHVVKGIADALGVDHIYGGTTPAKRQAAIDAFQTDPDKRAMVCAITSMGIGVTLTAASDILMVEQDWVPGNNQQAEDRCHRVGQHNAVMVTYLTLHNSIDEDIWNMVENKQRTLDALDSPGVDQTTGSSAMQVANRLLERFQRNTRTSSVA